VETASAHRTLRELGCDFAQGFHLSRPLPADECGRYLEAMTSTPATSLALASSGAAEHAA
jgi:EAL domain-containing protein (putative c-di-GMP-specific phosphodiesterase class I)